MKILFKRPQVFFCNKVARQKGNLNHFEGKKKKKVPFSNVLI